MRASIYPAAPAPPSSVREAEANLAELGDKINVI